MNERIRELAEQAGAETWSRAPMRAVTGLAFTDEKLEKFAELIVRECILALWTEECRTSDLAILDHNRNVKKIKEHFGVEENELNNNRL